MKGQFRRASLSQGVIFAALTLVAQGAHAKVSCVPFQLIGNQIYVKTMVNGKGPYNFLFDTGASGTGRADSRLVAALGLSITGKEVLDDGVNLGSIDVVRIAHLRMGDLEQRNVDLTTRDYNANRREGPLRLGIIGPDFYGDRTLTIDYPRRILLFDASKRLNPKERGVIAYTEPFLFPVHVGNQELEASLDTGSNSPLHIPSRVLPHISADKPVYEGEGRRALTTFKMYRARVHDPVRIGSVTAKNIEARFSDRAPRVQIGNAFLKDYIVEIDQASKLIAIRSPMGAVSPKEVGRCPVGDALRAR
jgi:hypothetical protein